MSLTTERYAEIDAELHRMQKYLAVLAEEIDDGNPTYIASIALHQSTIFALGALSTLRYMFTRDREGRA